MNGGIWEGEATESAANVEYVATYVNSPAVVKTVTVKAEKWYSGLHVAQAVADAWNEKGFPRAVAYFDGSDDQDNPRGRLWIAADVQSAEAHNLPHGISFDAPVLSESMSSQ